MILPRALVLVAVLAGLALTLLASAQDTPATSPDKPTTVPAEPAAMEYALIETTQGDIVVALNQAKAPVSVKNFLAYTERGFYDGTIFHRVMDGFMIQGGGFTPDLQKKPTDRPIVNEWQNGLKNAKGTIAMARLGRQPDSATSQFFINVKDNFFLDEPRDGAGYAVFGHVAAGMKTVERIKTMPTGRRNGMGDVPLEAIIMKKVRKLTAEEAKERIAAEAGPSTAPATRPVDDD